MKTMAQIFVIFLVVVIFIIPCLAGSYKHHWRYRAGNFLGLSEDLVLGDVGLVGLEEACMDTFGRKTRVCTSEEIIKAAPLREPIPDDGAWVYPTTVDATPDLINGGWDMFDFSLTNASSLTNFSCRVWTTLVAGGGDPAQGLIVYGYKEFRTDNCDMPRAVVCCKAK